MSPHHDDEDTQPIPRSIFPQEGELDRLAQEAYRAYSASKRYKDDDGRRMLMWDELSPPTQRAWQAAAARVRNLTWQR
jgi:hypothetical protein